MEAWVQNYTAMGGSLYLTAAMAHRLRLAYHTPSLCIAVDDDFLWHIGQNSW